MQVFSHRAQDEEGGGEGDLDALCTTGSIQKQKNLTENTYEKWDLKNFINSFFYFFLLKDNSNSLLLPCKSVLSF